MASTFSLVGETSLLIQCAEVILKKGGVIKCIVSADRLVQDYALSKNIQCFQSVVDHRFHCEKVDFLLSIVNPMVLSFRDISVARYAAINYHDSLLPSYAGVNATSWAIYHGEKCHGISWHAVDKLTDAGDIYIQRSIKIDENDTAFDLNLKCYQAAIDAFVQLLSQLLSHDYHAVSQNLQLRSFYSYRNKPAHFGFINWLDSAEAIYRLVKASHLGDYPNCFCANTCLLNQQLLSIKHMRVGKQGGGASCGTVVFVGRNVLQVETGSSLIDIYEMCGFDGSLFGQGHLSFAKLAKVGDQFSSLTLQQQEHFAGLEKDMLNQQKFWEKEFREVSSELNEVFSKPCLKPDFQLSWELVLQSAGYREFFCEKVLVSALLVYLFRLNHGRKFSVKFSSDYIQQLSSKVSGVLCDAVPLTVDFDQSIDGCEAMREVKKLLSSLDQHVVPAVELLFRKAELSSKFMDLPVLINMCGSIPEHPFVFNAAIIFDVVIAGGAVSLRCLTPSLTSPYFVGVVDRLKHDFQSFYYQLVSDFYRPIKCIDIVDKKRLQVTYQLLNVEANICSYQQDIANCFAESVKNYSSHLAVTSNLLSLSYAQLGQLVDQLSPYIKKYSTVGVHCVDGINYLVSTLAVIKAGAVFVPIDTAYPVDRKRYIFEDAELSLLISDLTVDEFSNEVSILSMLAGRCLKISEGPEKKLPSRLYDDPLIYLMYTSGSTGKPKGVAVSRKSFFNLCCWYSNKFFSQLSSTLIVTSLSFDLTQKNIFSPLFSGGQVIFRDYRKSYDVFDIARLIHKNEITHINCTPSMFYPLMQVKENHLLSSLREVVLGAEHISGDKFKVFLNNYPKVSLFNTYGPAECTDIVSCYDISREDVMRGRRIAIGKVIDACQAYVLDEFSCLLPCGVPGELYVTGRGLMQGYYNKPFLSKKVLKQI